VDNHLRAGSNAISNVGVGGDAGIVSPSRIARSDPGGGWAGLPAAAAAPARLSVGRTLWTPIPNLAGFKMTRHLRHYWI
jgi:hypothetical protein